MVHYILCGINKQLLVFHLDTFIYCTTQLFISSFKFIPIITLVVVCCSTLIWYYILPTISLTISLSTIWIIFPRLELDFCSRSCPHLLNLLDYYYYYYYHSLLLYYLPNIFILSPPFILSILYPLSSNKFKSILIISSLLFIYQWSFRKMRYDLNWLSVV